MQQSKPHVGNAKQDLLIVVGIGAIWLGAWLILTIAAALSFGHPTASPTQFVTPAYVIKNYTQDHGIVWWHLVGAYGKANPVIFWVVLLIEAGALSVIPFAIRMQRSGSLNLGPFSRFVEPKNLDRASRWATAGDLSRLRVRKARGGCITLGRRSTSLIATEKETSVLVIGPTRSGKTSGLVIPNLFEWEGPAIVTSTKSELVAITGAYRQSVGPVYVYDPTGEISDQYTSVTWSPITGCHDLDYAWNVATWLCAGLQSGGGKGDNDWAHWAESGKLLIAPLLFTAASTGQHSIVDVRTWILNSDLNTPMALLQEMLATGELPIDSDPERAMTMLMSIDQRPEKERGTVFSTVTRIFNVFNQRAVAQSAMTSRFNPQEFLRRNGTLYLCTPRDQPERIASLFVGILMTAVTQAYGIANTMHRGRLEPELGLFLDELANVVPIEDLPSMASQGAGRGVVLMSIVQDLSQLRARYGVDKANSILNNHPCKIVLPGISDPETTEQIARMVGKSEYVDVSLSSGADGKQSKSYNLRSDQMATPDALRQLQEGTGIVLYKGKPPTIVNLRPWYLERHFVELSERRFYRNAEFVSFRESA